MSDKVTRPPPLPALSLSKGKGEFPPEADPPLAEEGVELMHRSTLPSPPPPQNVGGQAYKGRESLSLSYYMFEIIVKKRFLASHGLRHYKGSQEPPHDHQWIVEARFHAEALDKAGCAIDFRDIDRALQEILSQFQGKTLNDLDPFRNTSPSAENVARYIFTKLSEATIKQESRLVSLTAWEDEEHGATYKE